MKQHLKTMMVLSSVFLISIFVSAQGNKTTPVNTWMEKGYWVVESNVHSPLINIIYIYSNNDSLIYKEKIEGMKINIKKHAVRKKLDKVVAITLFAFSNQKQRDDKDWLVKNILKPLD